MKSFLKCQEKMTIQQKIYLIICIIKIILNLLYIYILRQRNTNIPQQFNFVGKLEQDNGTTMFFHHWKAAKNYFRLYFRFFNCNRMI